MHKSVSSIGKYQLIFKQLEQGTIYRDPDDMTAPEGRQTPKQNEPFQEWAVVDELTTASKQVMAGLLRAKADELDPPKAITRGYGD